ncbi:hypothetical protein HDU76_003881, partial [Blyttiomyces sp. JEL0837]
MPVEEIAIPMRWTVDTDSELPHIQIKQHDRQVEIQVVSVTSINEEIPEKRKSGLFSGRNTMLKRLTQKISTASRPSKKGDRAESSWNNTR